MCGRYFFPIDIDEVLKSFFVNEVIGESTTKGEIFPGTKIPVILQRNNSRILTNLYWGIKLRGKSIINVRFETADEKPMFKDLIKYSRCIVPASCFYEWKTNGKAKEKMDIHLKSGGIISLGGIYGTFMDENGKEQVSILILTVPAAESISHIHHRMPLVIAEDLKDEWLSQNTLERENDFYISKCYNHDLDFRNADSIQQISFL